MKKLLAVFTILMFSVSANYVIAETFQVTTSDGTELSLMIAPKTYAPSGGKAEIRVPGTWTYSKGSASLTNGVIYPTSWSNYEKDPSGTLSDNDLSQGAMTAIFYAVPSTFCTGGAILTAIMEMPKATGITSIGAEITMTPMSGFLCGTQISSFTTYTLTAVTVTTANISGSKTTTGTGGTTSTFDFTGTYKAEAGIPGAPTLTLSQTGTALTGTAVQSQGTYKLTLTITGTVTGQVADVKVVTSGTNGTATCAGSGAGLIFRNNSDSKKVSIDIKAASSSSCGGNFFGSFVKQ